MRMQALHYWKNDLKKNSGFERDTYYHNIYYIYNII